MMFFIFQMIKRHMDRWYFPSAWHREIYILKGLWQTEGIALLIHDSLHDIMFQAPLQRIVHCVRSKKETRSDDSRLVLHVLLPATSSYYLWSSVCYAWSTIHSRTVKPFTASLVSGTMSYCSFSPGTTVLCPWCWLTENIQQSALCLWLSLVFWAAFQRHFFSISTVLLRFGCSKARQCRLGNSEELFSDWRWECTLET